MCPVPRSNLHAHLCAHEEGHCPTAPLLCGAGVTKEVCRFVGACVGAWAAAQRWRASAALSEVHAPRRAAAAWLHNVRHHRREGDLRRRPRAEAQRHPQRHAQRRRQVSHRRDSRRRHRSAKPHTAPRLGQHSASPAVCPPVERARHAALTGAALGSAGQPRAAQAAAATTARSACSPRSLWRWWRARPTACWT